MFRARMLILSSLLAYSCAKEKPAFDNTENENPGGYDFNALTLNSPPFEGTIFVTGDIITAQDPSLFESISYGGTAPKTMYDRRNGGGWVTLEPHLFPTTFSDGLTTEIQINPEFNLESAEIEARRYAFMIGQLPTALRRHVETMWIHKGEEAYGGGNNNILVHTGMTTFYENYGSGIVEETLIHEAAHSSIDAYYYASDTALGSRWREAVAQDGNYISTYARDYPLREDIAELFPLYVAVKFFPDRISTTVRDKTLSAALNRILFFDTQNFNLNLYKQN